MSNLPPQEPDERPFAFALPDSETSLFPMAGTVVDQIIALQEMGKTELADKLIEQEQRNLLDTFATEEALVREARRAREARENQ